MCFPEEAVRRLDEEQGYAVLHLLLLGAAVERLGRADGLRFDLPVLLADFRRGCRVGGRRCLVLYLAAE